MGLRFRKSTKIGPFRITASKSGISYSAGGKGFRVTKQANGKVRKTVSIPGTGISYSSTSGKTARAASGNKASSGIAIQQTPPKNKWVAFFLCLFGGFFGLHKFYEGKIGMGILYLCTCGLFFIGVIIDLISILSRPSAEKSNYGTYVAMQQRNNTPPTGTIDSTPFFSNSDSSDKRISNLPRIHATLCKNKEWGEDLVLITTNRTCPVCSEYNHRIFSISGNSHNYSKLPIQFYRDGGFCPNCIVGITTFFPGL